MCDQAVFPSVIEVDRVVVLDGRGVVGGLSPGNARLLMLELCADESGVYFHRSISQKNSVYIIAEYGYPESSSSHPNEAIGYRAADRATV